MSFELIKIILSSFFYCYSQNIIHPCHVSKLDRLLWQCIIQNMQTSQGIVHHEKRLMVFQHIVLSSQENLLVKRAQHISDCHRNKMHGFSGQETSLDSLANRPTLSSNFLVQRDFTRSNKTFYTLRGTRGGLLRMYSIISSQPAVYAGETPKPMFFCCLLDT